MASFQSEIANISLHNRFKSRKWIGVVYVMAFNILYIAAQIVLAVLRSPLDLQPQWVVLATFAMVAGYWGINYFDQKLDKPLQTKGPKNVVIQAAEKVVEDAAAQAVGFCAGENK
jgi:Na+/proline symporter